jgi:undecaprenyl-diphosphatase
MLLVFVLWTAAIQTVDVQAIGPRGSTVGFATLNRFVHHLTGVHMALYTVTDWLGLVPLGVAAGFGVMGLAQWRKRKHILKVDDSILVLGGFYIAVMAAYLFFEVYVVNVRPVLIDGRLEASYPSSTTMLTLCVMPTAVMQLRARIRHHALKRYVSCAIAAFTAFMVVGRLASGVHWFTDIVGGALLSAGLVLTYRAAVPMEKE